MENIHHKANNLMNPKSETFSSESEVVKQAFANIKADQQSYLKANRTTSVNASPNHQIRVNILKVVEEKTALTASEIAGALNIAENAITEQIIILRAAGLLVANRSNRKLHFSLAETIAKDQFTNVELPAKRQVAFSALMSLKSSSSSLSNPDSFFTACLQKFYTLNTNSSFFNVLF